MTPFSGTEIAVIQSPPIRLPPLPVPLRLPLHLRLPLPLPLPLKTSIEGLTIKEKSVLS
jgi:hypothetical protein